jgi:hypothetical protein
MPIFEYFHSISAFPGEVPKIFSFSAAGRLSLPAAENRLYKKVRGRKGEDAVKFLILRISAPVFSITYRPKNGNF